ncbi:nuclear transport factor 2 family protein [Microbacterium sp. ZW T5_45]|uniref:nuclear transport factor 2 family protein n=1 Tax=Microbacterium sp. ZW T5_45 TaxID=3378080 RepID=UPI0038518303
MDDSVMIRTLRDERSVHRAVRGRARAMDERGWTGLTAILDAAVEADFGTGRVSGSGVVVATIRGYFDNCGPTQHLLGNVIVDVAGGHGTQPRVHPRHAPERGRGCGRPVLRPRRVSGHMAAGGGRFVAPHGADQDRPRIRSTLDVFVPADAQD